MAISAGTSDESPSDRSDDGALAAAAAAAAKANAPAPTISADEIALYDRQIRLWGLGAQERLRTAHVLIITMKALANEVAKNLVLAGVGAVTVLDPGRVSEEDLAAQFLVAAENVGQNRAEAAVARLRKLNPRVRLHALTQDIRALTRAHGPASFFQPYDVVVATGGLDLATLVATNGGARDCGRAFYAAEAHGFYGYVFADLIEHDYVIERQLSNVATRLGPETATRAVIRRATDSATPDGTAGGGKAPHPPLERVTKRETYCPLADAHAAPLPPEHVAHARRRRQVSPLLSCLRALWQFQDQCGGRLPVIAAHADTALFTTLATEHHRALRLPPETLASDFIRGFLLGVGVDLVPVTAFLGGALAQDVINVLGGREQPIQNWLLFDGDRSVAVVYAMYPPPGEGGARAGEGKEEGKVEKVEKEEEEEEEEEEKEAVVVVDGGERVG